MSAVVVCNGVAACNTTSTNLTTDEIKFKNKNRREMCNFGFLQLFTNYYSMCSHYAYFNSKIHYVMLRSLFIGIMLLLHTDAPPLFFSLFFVILYCVPNLYVYTQIDFIVQNLKSKRKRHHTHTHSTNEQKRKETITTTLRKQKKNERTE